MSLTIKCFSGGMQQENTYLIIDNATGTTAVIDPGYYGEDIGTEIGENPRLKYILLTHGHYDHFAAAELYINKYPDALFAVPEREEYLLNGGRDNKWMALGRGTGVCPKADIRLSDGDLISIGETVLRVIETPGHTEGSVCYVTDKEVFSGDTLFRLSIGNSSLETGDRNALLSSIHDKLFSLSDDIVVFPGHGPETTVGFEKINNPFV